MSGHSPYPTCPPPPLYLWYKGGGQRVGSPDRNEDNADWLVGSSPGGRLLPQSFTAAVGWRVGCPHAPQGSAPGRNRVAGINTRVTHGKRRTAGWTSPRNTRPCRSPPRSYRPGGMDSPSYSHTATWHLMAKAEKPWITVGDSSLQPAKIRTKWPFQ